MFQKDKKEGEVNVDSVESGTVSLAKAKQKERQLVMVIDFRDILLFNPCSQVTCA